MCSSSTSSKQMKSNDSEALEHVSRQCCVHMKQRSASVHASLDPVAVLGQHIYLSWG